MIFKIQEDYIYLENFGQIAIANYGQSFLTFLNKFQKSLQLHSKS